MSEEKDDMITELREIKEEIIKERKHRKEVSRSNGILVFISIFLLYWLFYNVEHWIFVSVLILIFCS